MMDRAEVKLSKSEIDMELESLLRSIGYTTVMDRPYIDHREYIKMQELMIEQGWKVVEIKSGDYKIRHKDQIAMVERKAMDFLGGQFKGNLMLQLKEMYAESPDALHHLLIVDRTLGEVVSQAVKHGVYINAVYAFVASLIAHGFYPVFSGSTENTAKLLDVLRRKVFEVEMGLKPIHHKIKIEGATIITFPGVDEKIGVLLAKRFKTVENMCKASVDDLQELHGIGPKKAISIYDYLHSDLRNMFRVNIPKIEVPK